MIIFWLNIIWRERLDPSVHLAATHQQKFLLKLHFVTSHFFIHLSLALDMSNKQISLWLWWGRNHYVWLSVFLAAPSVWLKFFSSWLYFGSSGTDAMLLCVSRHFLPRVSTAFSRGWDVFTALDRLIPSAVQLHSAKTNGQLWPLPSAVELNVWKHL